MTASPPHPCPGPRSPPPAWLSPGDAVAAAPNPGRGNPGPASRPTATLGRATYRIPRRNGKERDGNRKKTVHPPPSHISLNSGGGRGMKGLLFPIPSLYRAGLQPGASELSFWRGMQPPCRSQAGAWEPAGHLTAAPHSTCRPRTPNRLLSHPPRPRLGPGHPPAAAPASPPSAAPSRCGWSRTPAPAPHTAVSAAASPPALPARTPPPGSSPGWSRPAPGRDAWSRSAATRAPTPSPVGRTPPPPWPTTCRRRGRRPPRRMGEGANAQPVCHS